MSACRQITSTLAALAVLGGALGLSSAQASAKTIYQYASQLTAPPGGFNNSLGLAVDDSVSASDPSAGDVYVANGFAPEENRGVYKFDSSGGYIAALTGPPGGFVNPNAVAVGPDGTVYVADVGAKVVDVFNSSGSYLSQLTGFTKPGAVAVDDSTSKADPSAGSIYVADRGADAVDKFNPAGEAQAPLPEPPGGFLSPTGVAVDPNGSVYVSDPGGVTVDKFSAGGDYVSQLAGPPGGFGEFAIAGVASDPAGDVFVADDPEGAANVVDGFDASGTFQPALTLTGPPGGFGRAENIAADAAGEVYVADVGAEPIAVDLFRRLTLPDLTTSEPAGITATSATLQGTVNPLGTAGASYYFQYGAEATYGQQSPAAPGTSVSGTSSQPASTTLTGLIPNSTYHYRLDATNDTGLLNEGPDETFTTLAVPPAILAQQPTVESVSHTSVVVSGSLNPENAPTFYHFAYGPTASYGAEGPELEGGYSYGQKTVSQLLAGLEPDTTYHYALVATNKAGTVTGPDQTFTTSAPTPPTLETGGVSEITQTTATITGTIDLYGEITRAYGFDLGIDTNYTQAYVVGHAEANQTSTQTITQQLQGLQPATTYHYRLFATNTDGTTHSVDGTFTTQGPPNPSGVLDILVVPPAAPLIATTPIAFPGEPTTSHAVPKRHTKKKTTKKKTQKIKKKPRKRPRKKK